MRRPHFYFLFFTSCLFVFSTLSAQQMRIQDPKNTWRIYSADIKEALISIKPHGLFIEYGIYLSYSAPDDFGLTPKDTFEVQHYFQLPEKAIVNDSWLWVNDNIMQAKVLDRWSAFNIYEGIVNRRRDPSILYKNTETNYEFRIFPLAGGKNIRKVKISFLVPADWKDGRLSSDLPLSMFNGAGKVPDLKLIAYENSEWNSPSLSISPGFQQEADSLLGPIKTAVIKSSDLKSQSAISIVYHGAQKGGIYFSHYADKNKTDEGIYQLAVNPKALLPANSKKPRKILILIDHDESSSLATSEELLRGIKMNLLSNLEPGDSFNIFYNKLTIKKISQDWLPADSASINYSLSQITPGSTSSLKAGLSASYEFLNRHPGGSLLVFSADQSLSNQAVGQKFKDELVREYKYLAPTFVVDYANFSTTLTWYNGTYYYGNELFYLILTTNTLGNQIHILKYPENLSLQKAITEMLYSIDNNQFGDKSIELTLKPLNGACFDRIEYNSSAENPSKPILQCGRYKGSLPIQLETTVVANGEIHFNSLILPVYTANVSNEKFIQILAGLKINDQEARGTLSNTQITNLISFSKQNRVLSRYTAFLALEPGMQEICTSCINETKTGGTVSIDGTRKDSLEVTVFPNPFTTSVTFEIEASGLSNDIELSIYNAQGQAIVHFENPPISDNKIRLNWDGGQFPAGFYYFNVQTGTKQLVRKVIKME